MPAPPFFVFLELEPEAAAAPPSAPSFDVFLLDFLLDDSRGTCCGDVSPDVPDDGPALDIAADFFLPFFSSAGVAGASGSMGVSACDPRTRLLLRVSRAELAGVAASVEGALRLREPVGGGAGVPASVAVAGDAWVSGWWWLAVVGSALSLAEERVTLGDMGKRVCGRKSVVVYRKIGAAGGEGAEVAGVQESESVSVSAGLC